MSDKQTIQVDEGVVLEIIKSKNVHTFFQPVVSISTKSIIGFEAFSRGGGSDSCVIDPKLLFHDDLRDDLKVDVDRLCREKAFEQFKPISSVHKDMLLFVNVNPDILPVVEAGSNVLKHQVSSLGIDFRNVAIECSLGRATSREIETFADMYHELGFKICLDNCAVGDSFSQIISRIRPDFVKVNRSFYAKGEREACSAKALDIVQEVAGRVGASIIAQGVESEEDSIRLLTAGVHLQQGYYYTKDENAATGDPARMFYQKIIQTYDKFKKVKRQLVKSKKERFSNTFRAVASICSKFASLPEGKFDDACKTVVRNVEEVTSMFVVDEVGEQVTERAHVRPAEGKAATAKVLGTQKGVDHSIRDYVMYLDVGYEKYVTKPFVSPYTGEETCIISKPFYNNEGLRYIVCLEMPYPG